MVTPRKYADERVASVGSRGDSYGNALAEAFNSLSKAELVRNRGPWRSITDRTGAPLPPTASDVDEGLSHQIRVGQAPRDRQGPSRRSVIRSTR